MKQISPVKRRIGRTKPVPQVAPYENVNITRRERLLKNARNQAQTIPTPDKMPADGPDWYQESTTLVKSPGRMFLDPADLHLDMATPQNLSFSAKRFFEAFCRAMKSPRQQPTHGQVAANLFRDKSQQHRRPQSPGERKEKCQDKANVPIDTLAYRKHFSVHHDRYLEDPHYMKRCKISSPTEACITESTAAEMKRQVFLLTQNTTQAEAEGRTEDARSLKGLIRTTNETLKTCSIMIDRRIPKKRPPKPQGSYYLENS
ncbi:hypothetical protein SARC_01019 [Sphaeroforma arctica JP610]|uniref:Uncharacterized protein n=1 Tax=Sphaeroforma arctica JP610 TaxID=667725 RepID=A0A0L0GCT3_9EUKA|nr:hypothetical protein SARC_01019 [Sphaeroforma arctica JP610]KNC86825.1 hypothetical protein SARC_01019 [Sphaeroforma arctica JP610]|eukprot:XP_014160727.1 hypothetical protein SARC_01019 [Sphaeroforma arctica JP610]